MTAAVLSSTFGTTASPKTLIPLTHQAGSAVPIIGSWNDVSSKMGGNIGIRFGRRSASAAGAGAKIIIEASLSTDGSNPFELFTYTTDFAACASQAVNGTCAGSQPVVPVTATANFPVQTPVFIANGTASLSEWGVTTALTANTNFTLRDNLANAQTGSTVYTAAEVARLISFPKGIARIRAIFDGLAFTQNCAVEVWFSTVDSIG